MRDVKRLEKKHGQLKRRKFDDMSTKDKIWHWYFNLDYDIILTKNEEQTREILQLAYDIILKKYPGYSLHRIANYLGRHLETQKNIKRTYRQCLNYVNDSMEIFGEPVDVSKEFKKQVYINRLHYLSTKAEKEKNFDAAIKATTKAADLENFNEGADEVVKRLMEKQDAQPIIFAATKEQLESIIAERRKKYLEDNAEETEVFEDDDHGDTAA